MNPNSDDRALPPALCVRHFERAGVLGDSLANARGDRAKAITVGKYLSAKIGRTIPICVDGRTGKATLRVVKDRSREKRYWFEVEWAKNDQGDPPKPTPTSPAPKTDARPKQPTGSSAPAPTPAAPSGTDSAGESGNDEAWD